jgi:hypothetical protein
LSLRIFSGNPSSRNASSKIGRTPITFVEGSAVHRSSIRLQASVRVNGYLPFEKRSANLFFQLVTRRYERGSMLITTNPRWTPKTGALSSERRNISAIMCATCAEENGCVVEQTMEGV